MGRNRGAWLALCLLCSVGGYSKLQAQQLETVPVTVSYAEVGPVVWMPVAGIKAMLAAPQINAGARIMCFDVAYKCDIGVRPRTIADVARPYSDVVEQLKSQFRAVTPPPPDGATLTAMRTPNSVEVSFVDLRTNAKYRHTTMALLMRGVAVFSVFAQGPDSATVAAMVNIARTARQGNAQEMLAQQLGQFVNVCTNRVPATQPSNERARAVSPFSENALLGLLKQRDTTMTLDRLRASAASQTSRYATMYDQVPPVNRQTFCQDLPRTIAAATRELRTM